VVLEEADYDMGYEIQLASGTEIRLVQLHQYRTYIGLIEGRPTHGLNQDLVARAMKTAQSMLYAEGTPHLIAPLETSILAPSEVQLDDEWQPAKLPDITCIGEFKSFVTQDPEEAYSFAVIVWFQDEFALPIDPMTLNEIRRLKWRSVAIDATD
jgi:hypothetical protein